MRQKSTILAILLILGTFNLSAQVSFQKWISTPQDEFIENMSYIPTDFLLLTIYRGELAESYFENFTHYSNVVYKSDFELSFSDSLYIDEIGDYDVLVKNFLKVDSQGWLFWAKAMHKDTQDEQLCLLWFDENLNIVNSSFLGSTDEMEVISEGIVCSNGNLLFVGATSFEALQGNYILWEFDENANELEKVIFEEGVSYLPTVIEIPGTNKFHLCAGFETFQFDNELNFETVYDFPATINIHPQNQNKLISDVEYLKMGLFLSAPVPGSPWEMDMAFARMNENASVIETFTFGITDSIDTPGRFDFIDTDTIYFAGTRNLTNNPTQDSWVSLFTTNLQGEILEHQFWGGSGQYDYSGLTALPYGGFLLGVTRWDYLSFPETRTRDIFLTTENYGNPTTGLAQYSTNDDKIKVFPNPGHSKVWIQADKNDYIIRITDTRSKLVLENSFYKTASIDVSQLAVGIYFYEISIGNEIIRTGKWIKQ